MHKMVKNKYPCGICHYNCGPNDCSVFCDGCRKWFHDVCEILSSNHMKQLEQSDREFLCTLCTFLTDTFDYESSLKRLETAALNGITELRKATQIESILLRNSNDENKTEFACPTEYDSIATALLLQMGNAKDIVAVSVTGDGNCLFNALSVAIQGDESAADRIRVLSTIEIVNFSQDLISQLMKRDIHLVSPDLDVACVECARSGSYSSAWTIQAAANALRREIFSRYPPVNGVFDRTFGIMNTTFKPTDKKTIGQPIHIMWTSTRTPIKSRIWSPNHFVPLLMRRSKTEIFDIDDEDEPNIKLAEASLSLSFF